MENFPPGSNTLYILITIMFYLYTHIPMQNSSYAHLQSSFGSLMGLYTQLGDSQVLAASTH